MNQSVNLSNWNFYPQQGEDPIYPFTQQTPLRGRSGYQPPAVALPWVTSTTGSSISPAAPRPAPRINVANYRLIGVKDVQEVERVLRKETRTYPNDSKGPLRPKISLSESVTKQVTVEGNKIKSSGGHAGIQILGFATIKGQIQQQLSQRYAVSVQKTLTRSEELQVEVPPRTTTQLIITWKTIWLQGTAILGPRYGTDRAEVPYFIPQRLTFDWKAKDVPLIKLRRS